MEEEYREWNTTEDGCREKAEVGRSLEQRMLESMAAANVGWKEAGAVAVPQL